MSVELNEVKAPSIDFDATKAQKDANLSAAASFGEFPPTALDRQRIVTYSFYEKLFLGDHFEAFGQYIADSAWNDKMQKLRYVVTNFPSLISRVVADFLLSEPVRAKVEDDTAQAWLEEMWRGNQMDIQLYESALSTSYLGDAVFKIRKGSKDGLEAQLIIEEVPASAYFPIIDSMNVKSEAIKHVIAVELEINGKKYVKKEIHSAGKIEHELYRLEGTKLVEKVDLSLLGDSAPQDVEMTNVNFPLVVHFRNPKTSNSYFGISDYKDLISLFYAINNRLSSVDNILDKHSDPILTVPEGILDENGKVKKKALGVIEVGEGESGKPEYVVWDASLENAFKEIEAIVDSMLMVSEISPDIFGKGDGKSDSGKALKFKMIRTIAKTARKRMYFDESLKRLLFRAYQFAVANDCYVGALPAPKSLGQIELVWSDGLPVDELEQIEVETKKIDAGVQSKKAAIIKIDQVDADSADQKLAEIEEEKPKVEAPRMNLGKLPTAIA